MHEAGTYCWVTNALNAGPPTSPAFNEKEEDMNHPSPAPFGTPGAMARRSFKEEEPHGWFLCPLSR